MEWVLAAFALVLLVGIGLTPALRAAPAEPEPSTDQEREIQELFATVDAETSADLIRLLHVRTRDLIGRQVPVREIRAAPAPRVARIAFSSGDVVLVTSKTPGDLISMAKAMQVTSVTLGALSVSEQGPILQFTWNYGHSLEVYAVGLDQAD
ncbi:MAG: hypothetical protein WA880_11990 [Ornithinimicrobium sp.]